MATHNHLPFVITQVSVNRTRAPRFRNFYGRDPDIGPLLEYRGLGGG